MTRHTKIIGFIMGLVLLGSASAFLGFFVLISYEKDELAAAKKEAAEIEAHSKELAALIRLVEESEVERSELAEYIVDEEEIINFLGLLEEIAREQGVTFTIASLDTSEVNDMFGDLVVATNLTGPYGAVFHTLKLLETLPYQSSLEEVRISGSEGEGTWEGNAVLRVTKINDV